MNKTEEIIKIDKISELLKKAPTDDGTFYGALYDLYVFIGIAKGVYEINNNKGITLEELKKELEEKYENTSRKFS
jgi:hypothetical protein